MVLVGLIGGATIGRYLADSTTADLSIGEYLLKLLPYLISLYIAIFLQTIIHEAGHLVFGLLSGYTFSSFRIGSFMWVKLNGKIQFKRYSLAGTGGQCLMVPPDMVDGKFPVVLSNFGGVIMNTVAALICLVLYLVLRSYTFVGAFLLMMTLVGVAEALINGIPLHMGAVDNDGMNACSLGKNKAALRSFWLQLKANAAIAEAIRTKDMPDEWFELPDDSEMNNAMTATIAVFAANRMVDAHRFEEADALMTHLLEMESAILGVHRAQMTADRIYIELIGECRKEKVDAMLTKEQKQIMKAMKNHPSVIRTEYAYALLAEKDVAKAEKVKAHFEKFAKTYPYSADIESERELIAIADEASKRSAPN